MIELATVVPARALQIGHQAVTIISTNRRKAKVEVVPVVSKHPALLKRCIVDEATQDPAPWLGLIDGDPCRKGHRFDRQSRGH